jgi:hypothetical protein
LGAVPIGDRLIPKNINLSNKIFYYGRDKDSFYVALEDIEIIIRIVLTEEKDKYGIINNFDLTHKLICYDGQDVLFKYSFYDFLKSNKIVINNLNSLTCKEIRRMENNIINEVKLINELDKATKDLYKEYTLEKKYIIDENRYYYPKSLETVERNIMFLSLIYNVNNFDNTYKSFT